MVEKKIKIKFPDGAVKEYPSGVTGLEIAKSISEGLARQAVGIMIDGTPTDITAKITETSEINLLKFEDLEGENIFRHSSAHLMAQAVLRVFPEAKLTIGPVVNEGFYYDIDHPPFKEEDLIRIEDEMKMIMKADLPIVRKEMSIKEALKLFKDNPYKIEIIKNIEEFGEGKTEKSDTVSLYEQGEFIDLCRGPHLPRTGMIKAFKITKVAGAYWRGDAKNKQLQRLYGISFPDKKLLNQYLEMKEEAEKRDHRKIGKALNLYSFQEEAPGMPFFHDKGTFIWNKLVDFMTEKMRLRNYQLVKTPIILNSKLWKQSGHWEHYKENMYMTKIDQQDFGVKPMNCPGHVLIYKDAWRSYRDLPIRMGEFGLVHRHELSGVLSGLFRVRSFTQDDAHVYCTKEQIKDEIKDLLLLMDEVYSTFGFEYSIELSTKPEKAMGDPKIWLLAEETLQETLLEMKKFFKVNAGDGAFYGPKIDFHLTDAIGRTWQCGTIQLDFQMPEKFDMNYEGNEGSKERVVMIHRAILGSVERFLGILVEHYAGKFPLWISPSQVKVLTIADRHEIFADKVIEELKNKGIRVEADYKAETMNKKIRNAQLEQFNYVVVIGDKELESESVNVRTRDGVVHGTMKLNAFINKLLLEIGNKG